MDHSIWGLCWSPRLWKTTMSGILNAEMICGRGYVGIVRECRVIGVLLQMQCQTCSPLLPYKYSLSPNCYVCSCSTVCKSSPCGWLSKLWSLLGPYCNTEGTKVSCFPGFDFIPTYPVPSFPEALRQELMQGIRIGNNVQIRSALNRGRGVSATSCAFK